MRMSGYLALSRQAALQRDMTAIANNLANATTTAYRAEHTVFDEALARVGRRSVAFVQDVAQARDLAPGPITQTGNPFDLALEGQGYFAFATMEGVRYGRAGHLELDREGQLVNANGHTLLDDSGNPIALPLDEAAITVAGDGTISGGHGPLGRIGIVAFPNEQALGHAGGGLFAADDTPLPASTGTRVVQGALEGSNVQPVLEMTAMLASSRAFEGAQRLLELEHELERQAIERTARASG
jgi:flagellar basal-body rod protein FlgF